MLWIHLALKAALLVCVIITVSWISSYISSTFVNAAKAATLQDQALKATLGRCGHVQDCC